MTSKGLKRPQPSSKVRLTSHSVLADLSFQQKLTVPRNAEQLHRDQTINQAADKQATKKESNLNINKQWLRYLMYATITTTVLLASIKIRLHTLETAAKDADDECTAGRQATELAASMEATVTTAAARAAEFTKAATKLRIMALTQGESIAAATYAAAAGASKAAMAILNQLSENASKINAATAALRATATTAELLSVLKGLPLTDKAMATATNYKTQSNRPLSFTLANENGACMASRGKLQPESERGAKGSSDYDRITLVTAELRKSDGEATGDLFLCPSNSQTAFGPSQSCGTDGTNVGLKGGKVFETKLVKINRKHKNAGSEYNEPASGDAIIPHVETYKQQLKAIALGTDAARGLETVPYPSDWLTKAGQKVDTKLLASVLQGAGKLEGAQKRITH
uniref:Variant surface glycoprotein 1125.2650 n=1 Tax=Trypanosoma brucei TaxID=5691 RepID=A0A1J0R8L1_9TRYP|nr:variant surface glycoprotein 1125.2650 [Trypanosoma brucei]